MADIMKTIQDNDVKFIDLRFTDPKGKEQHVTVPASVADESFFKNGKMFDGSSIAGWKDINESDMILMPDTDTAVIDPFFSDSTLNVRCDIIEPSTGEGYNRDPRTIAKKAENYLKETGLADTAYFGPEPEFFIFDDVRYGNEVGSSFYEVDSEEACYNSSKIYEDGNTGHRPGIKGGYFPVPPVDSLQDIRSAMCTVLEEMGVTTEVHHHEVATAGQCEIGTKYDTLVKRADMNQILKYTVLNVAHNYGKTATFMPKPIINDNGNGMHVHQSLFKDGENLFDGDKYGDLSQMALHYIGGVIKHAKAINAFSNSATNSYKRLVPGFEAPTILTYSARNRSASIRIPYEVNSKARRIEVRFPDSCGNPYYTFMALMMAGIDGVQNETDPGENMDIDLFDNISAEEEAKIPHVCSSLDEALKALDSDRDFLKAGGVMDDDAIDAYIELKMEEVQAFQANTHPLEFEMYYSL
ncbi:MAG: type I glutamate--ammonia ligase [Gammaproteobacteria bacterium]|nr:type I glutamate--ammonia ligase [Gammaproteobacteria bacterium]